MAIHYFKQNYANFVYLTDCSYGKSYSFIDIKGTTQTGYTPDSAASSYMQISNRYSRFMHGQYTINDGICAGNSVNLTEEGYTEGKTKYVYAHSKLSTLAVTTTYAALEDGTYHTMLNISGYAKEATEIKGIVLNRWVPLYNYSYQNSYVNNSYWALCPLGYIELDVPMKLEAEKTFAITVDIKI